MRRSYFSEFGAFWPTVSGIVHAGMRFPEILSLLRVVGPPSSYGACSLARCYGSDDVAKMNRPGPSFW